MSTAARTAPTVSAERIARGIRLLRGQKVMLDGDLASLYGVETRTLVQAVKRNQDRFPSDFMFELTRTEFRNLRSQSVMPSWGGRRSLPLAFTEQGVSMLSSVLRSQRAVQVNIEIMRAFVGLRRILQSNTELERKLEALEDKYDEQFRVIFDAIRRLMAPVVPPSRRQIGFAPDRDSRKGETGLAQRGAQPGCDPS